MDRPPLFICSSSEELETARALKEELDDSFEVEIWDQGTFELGHSTLESLMTAINRFDFAVMILTPDDDLVQRERAKPTPRDNVIFESGLFIGSLGPNRAFLVYNNDAEINLPTDLAGVTMAPFRSPGAISLRAAVGSAGEKIKRAAKQAPPVRSHLGPSPKTPPNAWVLTLVSGALKLVCNALASPLSPDQAGIRAFIFRKDSHSLECTHFWATRQVREAVGELKFSIDDDTKKEIAVVQAAMEKRVVATQVSPLSADLEGVKGAIEEDLCFVIAAPIIGPDGEVWGTVDFDTSTDEGKNLLEQEMSRSVLFSLGQHLYLSLSGDSGDL